MSQTLEQLKVLPATHQLDAILVHHLPYIRWAIGFTGSNGLLFVGKDEAHFLTDGRYTEQAKQQVKDAAINSDTRNLHENLLHQLGSRKPRTGTKELRIGYISEHVSVAEDQDLRRRFPNWKLMALQDVIAPLVAVKSLEAIASLRKAQAITDKVFNEMLTFINPGMTEKAVAAEIVYRQLQAGADGISPEFWPIVASGPNSALPHADASDRRLQDGEFVQLDFGCVVGGYNSDMSRVVALGSANAKMRRVYDTVLAAQTAALQAAQAGVTGAGLDGAARQVVKAAGYDIPHGVGHGIGVEIHETPVVSPRNPDPLPAGAVVTIEPGIYLPGEFGIRIEDMVVLKDGACENLTASPKELIVI